MVGKTRDYRTGTSPVIWLVIASVSAILPGCPSRGEGPNGPAGPVREPKNAPPACNDGALQVAVHKAQQHRFYFPPKVEEYTLEVTLPPGAHYQSGFFRVEGLIDERFGGAQLLEEPKLGASGVVKFRYSAVVSDAQTTLWVFVDAYACDCAGDASTYCGHCVPSNTNEHCGGCSPCTAPDTCGADGRPGVCGQCGYDSQSCCAGQTCSGDFVCGADRRCHVNTDKCSKHQLAPFYRRIAADGNHFWTTDPREAIAHPWQAEQIACYIHTAQVPGTVPLHRRLNRQNGDHLWTTNAAEATSSPWEDEQIAGYCYTAQVPGSVPFHRRRNMRNNQHFYTTDPNEATTGDWQSEQVECYVMPSCPP